MKRHVFAWRLVALVALLMMCTLSFTSAAPGDSESQIQRGFDIAPVPLDLHGRNHALVGLGSYTVNAQGGCNDCHTHPNFVLGGDPYLGQPKQINAAEYLTGGRQFGPFTSRNLTPVNGRPADLTLKQFMQVMHKGTDFDSLHPEISPLLQVMPWPVYGDMTDRDLSAVYEYLSAIPSRPNNPNPGP